MYTKGACFRLSLPCLSDGNILGQCFDMKVFESFNLLQLINFEKKRKERFKGKNGLYVCWHTIIVY